MKSPLNSPTRFIRLSARDQQLSLPRVFSFSCCKLYYCRQGAVFPERMVPVFALTRRTVVTWCYCGPLWWQQPPEGEENKELRIVRETAVICATRAARRSAQRVRRRLVCDALGAHCCSSSSSWRRSPAASEERFEATSTRVLVSSPFVSRTTPVEPSRQRSQSQSQSHQITRDLFISF